MQIQRAFAYLRSDDRVAREKWQNAFVFLDHGTNKVKIEKYGGNEKYNPSLDDIIATDWLVLPTK